MLPSGPLPPNPAELLASPRLSEVLDDLSKQADVVILDSPPVLAVSDASILASQVQGALLVIDAGETRREAAQKTIEALQKGGAKVTGVVLNKQKGGRGGGYYYYYYGDKGKQRKKK